MEGASQKALVLIVARELASNLATPMFLIDAKGDLVYYNDAAEQLLGKPFGELGAMSSTDWGEMLRLETADGEPMRRRDSPPGIAFVQQRPAHDTLRATAFDGKVRQCEVTAYPLFARTGEMHGVVTIFWEATEIGPDDSEGGAANAAANAGANAAAGSEAAGA
jgi:PAS domain-containing protein